MNKALAALDNLVYSVERKLISVALGVMSLTVAMDVLHRRLADPRSRIGDWLLALMGASGDAAAVESVQGTVAPLLAGALTVLLVAVMVAQQPSLRARGKAVLLAATAGITSLLYGFAYLVETASSRVVYGVLLGAIAGAYLLSTTRWEDGVRRAKAAVGVALGGIAVGFGVSIMPVGYSWAQQFSLFLLLWVGFLGASVATRSRRHIQVDAFRKYTPAAFLAWYNAASLALAGAFCVFLLYVSYLYTFGPVGNIHHDPQIGQVPDWLITTSLPIAFGIMSVRFLAQVVQEVAAARAGKPSPFGRHDGSTH